MNLRLFRSVRFNIGLFITLALASALGTFLPQRHDAPEKVEQFLAAHGQLGSFMDMTGLFNVYHAPWYVFLLGLMAFDVVVCKLRSLPKVVHGEDKLDERLIATSPLKEDFVIPAPLPEAADRVSKVLAGRSYKLRQAPTAAGEAHLWAARQRLQRWGDFILHVTIVAILLGGFIGGIFGFEEFLPVTVGGVKSMEKRPWAVAVDDFEVDFYKDTGTARKYASHLRVVAPDGSEIARKRIVVNDPLDVGGVRFYQASWGMTGMLKAAQLELPRAKGESAVVDLPWRERVLLDPKTGLSAEAQMLFPDFAVTEDGQPTTRGMEPNNPAVLLGFFQDGRQVASVWVLKKHPHVCYKVLPDGRVQAEGHPPFLLKDFKPVLFTGLQVAFDPGARLVGWGCIMLLVGLGLHFYMHQRRLRILLTAEGSGTRVRIGGWNSQAPADFEPEFRSLVAALRA
jgi:cytochrome c biogenesis protein